MSWFLLGLSLLPGIRDLFVDGYFWSHDGAFHVVRLMHFYSELLAGQFPVRFGTMMAYGYGYPAFNYFYPLAYYLGSIIKLFGLSFGDSLRWLNIIATVFSVAGMFVFLKKHFSLKAAFLGSILFMYTPYRFLSMYVNGSIGIVLALGLLPWILFSIDSLAEKRSAKWVVILTIVSSMLPLAHNVSLLIFSVPIFLYAIMVISKSFSKKTLKLFFVTGILSVLISSFFWFPAITEMKFVGLGHNVAVNYKDHFPTFKQLLYSPWGYEYSNTGDKDGMSMQIGFANLFVIVTSLGVLTWGLFSKNTKSVNFFFLGLVIFSLIGIYLMNQNSIWIWKAIPILPQIQFPWRILMLTMTTCSILAAMLFDKFDNKIFRYVFGLLVITLLVVNNRNYLRTWERTRYLDSKFTEYQLYYGSTDIAWEAKPTWVKVTPDVQTSLVTPTKNTKIYDIKESVNPRITFTSESQSGETLVLNLFYWPSWKVEINEEVQAAKMDQSTGFLTIDIPKGVSKIVISIGQSNNENIGNTLSLFGLSGLLLFLVFSKRLIKN